MQAARALLPQLQAAAAAGADPSDTLTKLKLLMMDFPSAAAGGAGAPAAGSEEAALSCLVLEAGAELALRAGNLAAFERHSAMLAPLYSARRLAAARAGASGGAGGAFETAPQAAARRLVQGLALMHLLVSARLPELHCAVERLDAADRAAAEVAFPLAMEARLSEGSYNTILQASTRALPHALFAPFMARLVGTVRDDFAECAACAYAQLSCAAAQKMLLLDSEAALKAYIAERGLDWRVARGVVTFPSGGAAEAARAPGGAGAAEASAAATPGATPLAEGGGGRGAGTDAFGLMGEVLGFATSFERIV
jgi:hypothetical protein